MNSTFTALFFGLSTLLLTACSTAQVSKSLEQNKNILRVATFNVSVEATNYLSRNMVSDDASRANIVEQHLRSANHPQLKNIAEIIQRVRPDILLLNEFDYKADSKNGIELFINNYLRVPQNNQTGIDYPYFYIAPSNTGLATPFDLDNDGRKTGKGGDAMGFGLYPGQYGMALLSRFPIKFDEVETLQNFLWKDVPDALKPIRNNAEPWYSDEEWAAFRLASKSFWDVPVSTPNGELHIIASHPTPPTFDGDEDRNGKRNHDEIRLISDYLSSAPYLYTDKGGQGGLKKGARFVVLGDLNASPDEGDAIRSGIKNLLGHELVNSSCTPESKAGQIARPDNSFAAQHTAAWGLRVDYALPSSTGLTVHDCGMFWPQQGTDGSDLVKDRASSSDHRLVWVDVAIKDK